MGNLPEIKSILSYLILSYLKTVIANSLNQNVHYEKLNLWSKLISKIYIQLHIKVRISHSFRLSMFIKFCMQVRICMGSSDKKNQKIL